MRKILSLMALVAIMLIVASCNNRSETAGTSSKVITTTLDTTIAIPVYQPITATRYACDGRILPNPKFWV